MTSGPDGDGPLPPFKSWRPQRPSRPRLFNSTWLIAFGIGGIVLVALVVVGIVVLSGRRQPAPAAAPGQAAALPDTIPAVTVDGFVVRSGEIMSTVLARVGLDDSTTRLAIAGLETGGFDFRRMLPGDSIVVQRRDGSVARILYRRSFERVYCLDFEHGDCRVSMLLRSINRLPDRVCGGISSSLYQAMIDAGESASLIADYADIFGWEIDFFTETQPDDSFAVVVERKYADSVCIGNGAVLAARYWGHAGDFRAFRFTDPGGHTDYYDEQGRNLRKTFLRSPLHFSRITSYFGNRYHPIRRIRCPHSGVDYAAPVGTPVSCVADGRVTFAGWRGGYGKLVEVKHDGGYVTRYGHLSRFAAGITVGAEVEQGRTIGHVGSTGQSTGPHLHYEVRLHGSAINPLRMDVPRAEPVQPGNLATFNALRDDLVADLMPPGVRQPPRLDR